MGIVKLQEVVARQRKDGWTYCDDCAPENTDELRPISQKDYPDDEYAVVCDQCNQRVK